MTVNSTYRIPCKRGESSSRTKTCALHVTKLTIGPTDVLRRHPTGHHDDNFRLNQVATKKQNPSSEQCTDVLTATHVETEEAVCSAVGTGNPRTALPIVPVRLKINRERSPYVCHARQLQHWYFLA